MTSVLNLGMYHSFQSFKRWEQGSHFAIKRRSAAAQLVRMEKGC